jgi:hypothetical protein
MPAYSLGGFTFISANVEGIRGAPPPLPREMVSIFNTPGIDGVAVRNDGAWGVPFRYRTCAQDNDPLALKQIYQLAPGQVPQNLVWEGEDYDDASVRFTILSVDEFEINATSRLVVDGSLIASGGLTYLLYATWTLVPVDMS